MSTTIEIIEKINPMTVEYAERYLNENGIRFSVTDVTGYEAGRTSEMPVVVPGNPPRFMRSVLSRKARFGHDGVAWVVAYNYTYQTEDTPPDQQGYYFLAIEINPLPTAPQ